MYCPPGGIGACVRFGTPSYWFSRRSPCQCTVVADSVSLRTVTEIVEPWRTRSVGPGIEPPYPSMENVWSTMSFAIIRTGRATAPPGGTSTTSGRPAGVRSVGSVGIGLISP